MDQQRKVQSCHDKIQRLESAKERALNQIREEYQNNILEGGDDRTAAQIQQELDKLELFEEKKEKVWREVAEQEYEQLQREKEQKKEEQESKLDTDEDADRQPAKHEPLQDMDSVKRKLDDNDVAAKQEDDDAKQDSDAMATTGTLSDLNEQPPRKRIKTDDDIVSDGHAPALSTTDTPPPQKSSANEDKSADESNTATSATTTTTTQDLTNPEQVLLDEKRKQLEDKRQELEQLIKTKSEMVWLLKTVIMAETKRKALERKQQLQEQLATAVAAKASAIANANLAPEGSNK